MTCVCVCVCVCVCACMCYRFTLHEPAFSKMNPLPTFKGLLQLPLSLKNSNSHTHTQHKGLQLVCLQEIRSSAVCHAYNPTQKLVSE